LILRAFSSGCTALTGVEAVSDGVPAFKPPEAQNARIVLTWLGAILIVLFLGITVLAYDFGLVPRADETVVSQLARHVFGGGVFYYVIQAGTMLILLLAANTSFADFPRLSFFLARDRFIPRQFATQGDRLVFSNGIVILGGLAIVLLIIFGGQTHALIPLYAVGVFISFTLSQASMVRRWLRLRAEGWWWRVWLNGLGALVTGGVMLTIATTKFSHGAWIVVLLIPTLVEYSDQLQRQRGEHHVVTIVLPEFLPARWWQQLLHNQTALLIKGQLLFRKNVVVTDVPYHLKR